MKHYDKKDYYELDFLFNYNYVGGNKRYLIKKDIENLEKIGVIYLLHYIA